MESVPGICTPCNDCSKDECVVASFGCPDDEVLKRNPRGVYVDPVPDPFGQPYGLPRLPREPSAVGMKDAGSPLPLPDYSPPHESKEFAPEQIWMADGDANGDAGLAEDKAASGCLPMEEPGEPAAGQDGSTEASSSCCCFSAETNRTIVEEELVGDAFWCLYCCCAGIGCGPIVHQRLMLHSACLQCETEGTECFGDEGCASCITSCFCWHMLGQVPPRHRSPQCMCFNENYGLVHKDQRVAQKERADKDANHDTTFIYILTEAFTLFYFKVFGCAVSPCVFLHRPCLGLCKCLVCRCSYQVTMPLDEQGGCCVFISSCGWLYSHCRAPPLWEGNPGCAILGCKLHHMHHIIWGAGEEEESEYVKPAPPLPPRTI